MKIDLNTKPPAFKRNFTAEEFTKFVSDAYDLYAKVDTYHFYSEIILENGCNQAVENILKDGKPNGKQRAWAWANNVYWMKNSELGDLIKHEMDIQGFLCEEEHYEAEEDQDENDDSTIESFIPKKVILLDKKCVDCHKQIEITVRDWKQLDKTRQKDFRPLTCEKCEWESNLHRLKTMPYKEYLLTEHWQRVRERSLKRAKHRCQLCGAKDTPLDTHHNTYERRGEELPSDVISICRICHDIHHDAITKPK